MGVFRVGAGRKADFLMRALEGNIEPRQEGMNVCGALQQPRSRVKGRTPTVVASSSQLERGVEREIFLLGCKEIDGLQQGFQYQEERLFAFSSP